MLSRATTKAEINPTWVQLVCGKMVQMKWALSFIAATVGLRVDQISCVSAYTEFII